jgi:hypothetical protein
MKRLLIFVLLGPPLGMATGLFVMLPLLNGASLDGLTFDWHQIVLLPPAYFLGILPAGIVAAIDHALAKRRARRRVLWTACFGFIASFVPVLPSIAMGLVQTPWILPFGFIGAVPGAICAWLSGDAATDRSGG